MIIKYPTKFYNSLLPTGNNPGNVIYTISNNEPPKYNESFFQLPLDQEIRKQPERVYSKQDNRTFNGKLVYDIATPGQSIDGSGDQQFEIGQILEFTTDTTTNVDSYNVSSVEMRQDLWTVDYAKSGINDNEYKELIDAANTKYESITKEISSIGTEINNNIDNISLVQANINQSTKLLSSTILVLGNSHPTVAKIQAKINGYESEKAALSDNMAILQSRLAELTDEQNAVREVIR